MRGKGGEMVRDNGRHGANDRGRYREKHTDGETAGKHRGSDRKRDVERENTEV